MSRQPEGERVARFARCIRNDGYPVSLDIDKVYPVLSDPRGEEHGMLRVIDEMGEDYLFPVGLFEVADSSEATFERLIRAS